MRDPEPPETLLHVVPVSFDDCHRKFRVNGETGVLETVKVSVSPAVSVSKFGPVKIGFDAVIQRMMITPEPPLLPEVKLEPPPPPPRPLTPGEPWVACFPPAPPPSVAVPPEVFLLAPPPPPPPYPSDSPEMSVTKPVPPFPVTPKVPLT